MIGGANKWTTWVKEWAEKNDVTYSCAVSIPECNQEYHAKYGTRPSKKTLERQQARKDATTGKKQTKAQASLAEMGKTAKAKVAVASAVAEKIKKRRGRPPKVAEPEEEYVLTPTKGAKKPMAPPSTPPPISKAQVEAVKAKYAEPEDSKARKAQANRDRMAKLRADRKAQGMSSSGKTKMAKDNIRLEVMEIAEPTQSDKKAFSQKTIDEVRASLLAKVSSGSPAPKVAEYIVDKTTKGDVVSSASQLESQALKKAFFGIITDYKDNFKTKTAKTRIQNQINKASAEDMAGLIRDYFSPNNPKRIDFFAKEDFIKTYGTLKGKGLEDTPKIGGGVTTDKDGCVLYTGGAVSSPTMADYDMIIKHLLEHITDPKEPVDGKDFDHAIHFIKRIRAMKGGALRLIKQKKTAYPTLGGMMRQRATGLFRRKGGAYGDDDEGETDHEDNSDDEEDGLMGDDIIEEDENPNFFPAQPFEMPIDPNQAQYDAEADALFGGFIRRMMMRGGMDTPRPSGAEYGDYKGIGELTQAKNERNEKIFRIRALKTNIRDGIFHGPRLLKAIRDINRLEEELGIKVTAFGAGWEEKPAPSGNAFLDTITSVGHDLGKAHPASKYVNPFDAGFKFGEKVVAPALMKTKLGNPKTGIFSKKFWTIKKKHH